MCILRWRFKFSSIRSNTRDETRDKKIYYISFYISKMLLEINARMDIDSENDMNSFHFVRINLRFIICSKVELMIFPYQLCFYQGRTLDICHCLFGFVKCVCFILLLYINNSWKTVRNNMTKHWIRNVRHTFLYT